jgi:hypothetical protein
VPQPTTLPRPKTQRLRKQINGKFYDTNSAEENKLKNVTEEAFSNAYTRNRNPESA